MKNALVLGFGISGRAAAELLHHQHYNVFVFDDHIFKEVPPTLSDEFPFIKGAYSKLEEVLSVAPWDLVLLSPGINPRHPVLLWAKENDIPIVGEAEFALQNCSNRCIGITGTNGKTTVTLLLEYVLKKLGYKAKAVGNVGEALSRYFINPDPEDILIVELSSFQIETLNLKVLDTAVLLNITPDHLDRYPSYEEYARAKFKLSCNIKGGKNGYVLAETYEEFKETARDYQWIQLTPHDKQKFIQLLSSDHQQFFLSKAPYEQENYWFSALALQDMGISFESFLEASKDFTRPKHRIEFVKAIEGVLYFNDSKATNIDATIKAVDSMQGPVVLIAGGVHKGASYEIWKEKFKGKVKNIIVIGKAKDIIYEEMKNDFSVEKVVSLEEAVKRATEVATAGDHVLLSPGCSSFDMFRNYAERGEIFKQLVNLQERTPKP